MHKFPGKSFARTLAIVSTPDCSRSVLDLIDGKMRALIRDHALTAQYEKTPWLADIFKLVE
jgi:hypothetical protein